MSNFRMGFVVSLLHKLYKLSNLSSDITKLKTAPIVS